MCNFLTGHYWLLPQFAMAWLNSDAGRDHFFKSGKTTSGLGTINSTVIRTAPIPLPLVDIQRGLVAEFSIANTKANQVRTEAVTLRQTAWAAFESALFTDREATA